jgi:hypothetical protein
MSATQNLLSRLSLTESVDTEEESADVFASRLEWLTKVREELDENLIQTNMDAENSKKKKRDGKGAYTSKLKGKERKGGGVNKGKMAGQNYSRGPIRRESVEWLEDVRSTLEVDFSV